MRRRFPVQRLPDAAGGFPRCLRPSAAVIGHKAKQVANCSFRVVALESHERVSVGFVIFFEGQ